MNDHKTVEVPFKLCKHTDASDGTGPWPGSLQFYLQKAYHQTETQQMEDVNSGTLTTADSDEARKCLEQVLLEIDLHDEKPWRADRLADFFNYDLNERSFREYVRSQIRMRFENRSRATLGSTAGPGGYLGDKSGKKGGKWGADFHGGKGYGKWNHPGGTNYGYDRPAYGPYSKAGGDGGLGGRAEGGAGEWANPAGGATTTLGSTAAVPAAGSPGAPPTATTAVSSSGPPVAGECESIYIIGFPKEWQKQDLHSYFQQFGIVMNAHVIGVQQEGQRPAGIVNFITVAMAKEAIAQCNGKALPGGDGPMDVRFKMPGRREQAKAGKGFGGKGFKDGGKGYKDGGGYKDSWGGGKDWGAGKGAVPMGSPNMVPLGGGGGGGFQ